MPAGHGLDPLWRWETIELDIVGRLKVISNRMMKSVTVAVDYYRSLPKYDQRLKKLTTKMMVGRICWPETEELKLQLMSNI